MTYNHDLIIATWTHRDNDALKEELRKRWPELGHALDRAAVEDILQMANGDKPWTLDVEPPIIKPVLPVAVVEHDPATLAARVLESLKETFAERMVKLYANPVDHQFIIPGQRGYWRGPDIKGVYIDEHLPDTNEVIVRVEEGE